MKPIKYISSLLSIIFLISCSNVDNNDSLTEEELIAEQIEEVRTKTSAYHDFEAAGAAGWNTALSECVEHPTEGGMGIHYGRMEYMDGRVNHLEPQVLLYLPDGDNMEFLGVEYIVPFAMHSADAEPPVLFKQEFHANQEQEFWALHVWTEKDNSKGVFSDWNPAVSCE